MIDFWFLAYAVQLNIVSMNLDRGRTFTQQLADDDREERQQLAVLNEYGGDTEDASVIQPPPSPSMSSTVSTTADPPLTDNRKRSVAWDHFSEDKKTKRSCCNYCTTSYRQKTSTATMMEHIKHQHRGKLQVAVKTATPEVFKKKPDGFIPPLSIAKEAAIKSKLCRLIAAANLPFSIVERPEFRDFVSELNPSYKPPESANTVKAWLQADYRKYQQKVRVL